MPIEIKVGPPAITISHGRTFMVTTPGGEILPDTDQGVYSVDTRFVSLYRVYINHQPLTLVNSSQLNFYSSRFHLTNPPLVTEDGVIPANMFRVTITRVVNHGIHEEFEVANYSGQSVRLFLEVAIVSDFADLFEVRSQRIILRGKEHTQWKPKERQLRTSYDNEDFHRALAYCVLGDTPVGYANGRIFFELNLAPTQHWTTCCEMLLEHGKHIRCPEAGSCSHHEAPGEFNLKQVQWQEHCTGVTTSNNDVYRMYQQAIEDMGALRIYDMDVSDEAWVPAAGVPWFVTLFGRDSLIVSYQNMLVSPGFAKGALKRLAEYQATKRDDWCDAQPGKIMHEARFGELAHFHKIPFTPFYGTADATILYLIVLSETYRWTGDVSLLKEYREVIKGCLTWIDQYGDLDGDGFQEYKSFSPYHYENVGWKDAGDAVVYADGSQVAQPKGLCELQGYVYDAKMRMAEVFEALGEQEYAQSLVEQAATLKRKFNEVFWMEDEGCFAFGLDPEKKLITPIVSNVGHCLWSGIADQDKAQRAAKRLLAPDMWSGWGIRTLSYQNPAYNPFSYHRGSIWPHDNGIIAAGFKRYGLVEETNKVVRAIFDAIEHFEAYRPPELFAGVQREENTDFPILYPAGANIPQAWATGCIFHMVQIMLGLRADAPHKKLYVNPTLPDWLPDLELHRLNVGPCWLDLRFWREGNTSRWEVLNIATKTQVAQEDLIQVVEEPPVNIS